MLKFAWYTFQIAPPGAVKKALWPGWYTLYEEERPVSKYDDANTRMSVPISRREDRVGVLGPRGGGQRVRACQLKTPELVVRSSAVGSAVHEEGAARCTSRLEFSIPVLTPKFCHSQP